MRAFRRGTRIATARGEVRIEELEVGDLVSTLGGDSRPLRAIDTALAEAAPLDAPRLIEAIVVEAGALADGVPRDALWLGADQCLCIDGVLIPVRALVNDLSIRRVAEADAALFIGIELAAPALILAEAAPVVSAPAVSAPAVSAPAVSAPAVSAPAAHAMESASTVALGPRCDDGELVDAARLRLATRAQTLVTSAAPSELPAPTPWRSNLEVVERDRIEGWAQDLAAPDAALALRVSADGVPLGDVLAGAFRADLRDAGIGDGRHAFAFAIPGGLDPNRRHLIDVRRIDDGRSARRAPAVLEPQAAPNVARQAEPATWRGLLEVATRDRIEGWAWDERRRHSPLALVVLDNGRLIARVIANRYRRDLAGAGLGTGRHGFSIVIPGGLSPLTRHVVQVLGEADGCELPGSPVVLEASGGFDAALEYAVGAAVGALASDAERERVLAFLAAQAERLLQQQADAAAGRERRLIDRRLQRRWGAPLGVSRRALVVDDFWPRPDHEAGAVAIVSHMRALQALGFEVSFVAAESLDADPTAMAALRAVGIRCCTTPFYASVEEVMRRERDCFELIYLHRVGNASKYLALARRYGAKARLVYAVADLHHQRLARQAEVEQRPYLLAQSRRFRLAELSAASASDVVITHSNVEAQILRSSLPPANVHVVPWAVSLSPTTTPWDERRGIAFIGNFGFAPNRDAARWLVNEIMPMIWREDPALECLLVGSRMNDDVRRLAAPRILVVGHAADLATVFARVRLTIAPLRFGAGVKGKVLESLAAGVPCVMTPLAAEGIGLTACLAGAVSDSAAALAEDVLRLYPGGAETQAMIEAGRELIATRYSASSVETALAAAIGTG